MEVQKEMQMGMGMHEKKESNGMPTNSVLFVGTIPTNYHFLTSTLAQRTIKSTLSC